MNNLSHTLLHFSYEDYLLFFIVIFRHYFFLSVLPGSSKHDCEMDAPGNRSPSPSCLKSLLIIPSFVTPLSFPTSSFFPTLPRARGRPTGRRIVSVPVCASTRPSNEDQTPSEAAPLAPIPAPSSPDDPPFLPSPLLSSLYFSVGPTPPDYPRVQYSSYQLVRVGLPILDQLRQLRLQKSRQASANYFTVVKRVAQFALSIVLFFNPFK